MNEDSAQLICAPCERPLDGPSNPDADSMLSCSACGASETLQNIVREIQEDALKESFQGFRNGLARTARNSKHLSFKPGKPLKGAGRFKIRRY
tara:strand:+ start:349 stop:627 length:279 start_codon:yes stop_codon:yes gene_type:complete